MAKKWDDLTLAEKVEDLRRDMLKTMAFAERTAQNAGNDGAALRADIVRIQARLAQLESQAPNKEAAS